MNNIELEQKIKEIISKDNYFDMIIAAKEFESEYKKSDFYKAIKKPLSEVIKESKVYYFTNFNIILDGLQYLINNLSLDNLVNLVNQFGDTLMNENEEVRKSMEEMKDLLQEIKD